MLFTTDGYQYGGREFDRRDIARELVRQLPSVESVIFLSYLDPQAELDLSDVDRPVRCISFTQAIAHPQ